MKIKFTRHAKRRMKWRKIPKEEIELAVKQPDKLEKSSYNRRINVYKKIKKRFLKVSYTTKKDQILIITVIDKSK